MVKSQKVAANATTAFVPQVASGFVRGVLDKAIDGIGPLPSVAEYAGGKLAGKGGDVEKTVSAIIRSHVSLAGAQGFVTNLGGIAFAAATVPANVIGVTLVQCHLAASVAWLRGYDIEDPRVRNAILMVILGKESMKDLIAEKKLPSTPMAIATSPVHDPELDVTIAKTVTGELVGRTLGRRALLLAGKRIPFLGGVVGAGADGFITYLVGSYAQSELLDRRLPQS